MTNWAAELFPQHAKHSGAAAVLDAADKARADMRSTVAAERGDQVCDELDRLDAQDRSEEDHDG